MRHLGTPRDELHADCSRTATRRLTAQDVVIGRDEAILADIEAPGVAAAIWQRSAVPAFQTWMNNLPADHIPELRTTVPVNRVEAAVLTACGIAEMPTGAFQDIFASDIGALAMMFCKVMKTDCVRLRLEASDGATCPKFHTDNMTARLLCTFAGKGTEYVPASHEMDPGRIRSMRTCAVGLFRGTRWPSDERCGLLHRSPAPQDGAGPRLLLVIDAPD